MWLEQLGWQSASLIFQGEGNIAGVKHRPLLKTATECMWDYPREKRVLERWEICIVCRVRHFGERSIFLSSPWVGTHTFCGPAGMDSVTGSWQLARFKSSSSPKLHDWSQTNKPHSSLSPLVKWKGTSLVLHNYESCLMPVSYNSTEQHDWNAKYWPESFKNRRQPGGCSESHPSLGSATTKVTQNSPNFILATQGQCLTKEKVPVHPLDN